MRIHSPTGYSVCMRAQPLQLFHCTNPSLCRCVCWQVSPGKLEKKIQIISLHTMGTRLMPKIVGEHTLLIYFFFLGPKLWKARLWLLLIWIVCQSASRSGMQRYELEGPHPTAGHHHEPIVLLGLQAPAGLVAPVHSSLSCSLADFPA